MLLPLAKEFNSVCRMWGITANGRYCRRRDIRVQSADTEADYDLKVEDKN